jgi:opacity protein-like surface antigen
MMSAAGLAMIDSLSWRKSIMQKKPLSLLFSASCLLFAPFAFSQDDTGTAYKTAPSLFGDRAWSAGVNLTSSDVDVTDDNVFAFGVFGDLYTAQNLSVGLSLDYWADEFNSSVAQRVDIENLIVGANAKFHFTNLMTGLKPYVLAGLAAHRFQVSTAQRDLNANPADVLSEYDRDLEDVEGELGADFGAGLSYNIQTAMDVTAELRYRRILDRALDLDQMNYSLALAYLM